MVIYLTMILLMGAQAPISTWEHDQKTFDSKEACYEMRAGMIAQVMQMEPMPVVPPALLISSCEEPKDVVTFKLYSRPAPAATVPEVKPDA